MRVVWTPDARNDRRSIFNYISAENASAALSLDEAFSDKVGILVDHPEIGRPGRVAGTRELVAHRNYLLIYRVLRDEVLILRVLHGARLWPPTEENSP